MLLENKNAIIYGAGGGIGGVVARTFARAGAGVFLTGRTRESLEAVAEDITAAGGSAEVAVLDAMDEQAVDAPAGAGDGDGRLPGVRPGRGHDGHDRERDERAGGGLELVQGSAAGAVSGRRRDACGRAAP